MIGLNFIPQQSRKKMSFTQMTFNIPQDILWGGGVLFVAFIALVHVIFLVGWLLALAQLGVLSTQWNLLSADRQKIDELAEQSKGVGKRLKVLDDVSAGYMFNMAYKLNVISDSLPKGVWLSLLTLEGKKIVLKGYAASKQQSELSAPGYFAQNLKKDTSFANDFKTIEVGSLSRSKFNNSDVSEFTVNLIGK